MGLTSEKLEGRSEKQELSSPRISCTLLSSHILLLTGVIWD